MGKTSRVREVVDGRGESGDEFAEALVGHDFGRGDEAGEAADLIEVDANLFGVRDVGGHLLACDRADGFGPLGGQGEDFLAGAGLGGGLETVGDVVEGAHLGPLDNVGGLRRGAFFGSAGTGGGEERREKNRGNRKNAGHGGFPVGGEWYALIAFAAGSVLEKAGAFFDGEAMRVLATRERPLRIAMVIGSLARGGAEANLAMLARGLRRRGHSVAVLLLRSEGLERAGDLRREGVEVTELRVPLLRPWYDAGGKIRLPAAMARTIRVLREFRPDVVHAWLFEAEAWAAAAKGLGAPGAFVTTRQSLGLYKDASPWKQWVQNAYNGMTRAVVCNSRAVAKDVVARERNLERPRVAVIHSAVDGEAIRQAAPTDFRHAFGLAFEPEFVAVCVCNLFPYKGVGDLVDAWKVVVSVHRRAVLVVAGRDGGARREIAARIREHDLGRNAILAGPRGDVPSLLMGADLLVHPSREEGFPSAVLEGMAAGLAVVATDVGGTGEAVVDGGTGWLVRPRSPEELAAAILEAVSAGSGPGEAGRRRADRRFSPERVVEGHERLYLRVVGGSRAG